ncbi:hypothetical protein [Chromobacterium violaceum]
MKPEKVEIYVGDLLINWFPGSEVSTIIVKENQLLQIRVIMGATDMLTSVPQVFIEDHHLPLHREDYIDENKKRLVAFTSTPEQAFRESFGAAFVRLHIDNEEFAYPIEVLATKVTAAHAEKIIRYLTERRERIIRVCLSRTMRPAGMKDEGQPDPEMVISTAERVISIFLESRSDLRQQLRSKLVPTKVPAWRAEKSGSLIDPVDVIFNLDALRPGDIRQDVRLRGRAYSTQAIDVTTLQHEFNVEENTILIGGLYSIRRVISWLMDEIGSAFKNQQIANYDKEYVSLGEMMIKFTGGAMYERCARVVEASETLIKMLVDEFNIVFAGEAHPKITPYVRSSRLYRTIFEQYAKWYSLGTPTLEGEQFLIKLRTLSKIFEFFVLFRLFDYLHSRNWQLTHASMSETFDHLIPDTLVFEKDSVRITLSYEPTIFHYTGDTRHMDLVKLRDAIYTGPNWKPDYTLRMENIDDDEVRYIIIDAKYSSTYSVDKYQLPKLIEKYYNHQAVFNANLNILSRNEIMGVFAIFPEFLDQLPKPLGARIDKFGGQNKTPLMLPMLSGLPVSFRTDSIMEKCLDRAFETILKTLNLLEKRHRQEAPPIPYNKLSLHPSLILEPLRQMN